MKVIFLDMDGVVCTPRSHAAQGAIAPHAVMQSLDREAVGLINVLSDPPLEVRFVSCSTWRNIRPLDWMVAHLRFYGWRGQFHDDWRTGDLKQGEKSRGLEVNEWLSRHPEIAEYLILDDGDGFLPDQKPRLVRPNYVDGLSWENFKQAATLLHNASFV